MTRIVAPLAVQGMLPTGEVGPSIERVSPSESAYAAIYARHYTGSRGQIGRQLHYFVRLDGRVLGICAAGEAMFRCAPRDRWLRATFADPSICTDAMPPPPMARRVRRVPRRGSAARTSVGRPGAVEARRGR